MLLAPLSRCQVVPLEELVPMLRGLNLPGARFAPESSYLRAMYYQGECELSYFVNEAAQTYTGTVTVPTTGCCYGYDAWKNECCAVDAQACEEGTRLSMTLEPKKSLIVLFDDADSALLREPLVCCGERTELTHWKRSVCEAIAYPDFAEEKEVTLPDQLAQEQPAFSGFVRYESSFGVNGGSMAGEQTALELTDASEGV